MSLSVKLTDAASFQAYVQDYHDELLSELFVGFQSAPLFTAHEGVKGKKLLTQLVTNDLVTRYSATFAPVADALEFKPRNLVVADAKVDLKIIPKDFEGTYLGMYRKKGQDPMDLPFEGYILKSALDKIKSEMEYAIWRAEIPNLPTSTDKLIKLFDGIQVIIQDEITATNLTATTTGALTSSNAVAAVESVYAALGDAYLGRSVDVFLSPKDRIKFVQDYRDKYGKYYEAPDGSVELEVGTANVHILPGVPENCILITPKENIHYGYDADWDSNTFNFEQEDRSIKMWMDFKIGVNFGIVNDNIIAVNDQW